MLRTFAANAFRLSGHDVVHCHCRKHYLPDQMTVAKRVVFWGTIAGATGWLSYQVFMWALRSPGATRIG